MFEGNCVVRLLVGGLGIDAGLERGDTEPHVLVFHQRSAVGQVERTAPK